jgi:hypothetical protein
MVVSKVYEAVDTTERLDEQRLGQWLEILRHRPGDEAFNALIGVFCNAERRASGYLDQEYAQLRVPLSSRRSLGLGTFALR